MGEVIYFDFNLQGRISAEARQARLRPVSAKARVVRVMPPRRPLADLECHPVAMMLRQSDLIEQAAESIVAAELATPRDDLPELQQLRDEALLPLSEAEQRFAWEEAEDRLFDTQCKEHND